MWLSSCHVPCHVFVFSLRSRSYETSPWSRSICHVLYLWFLVTALVPYTQDFIFVTAHTTSRLFTIYVSLHCHALVITWRHYTLASLSFLSLTVFAVTLYSSRDVTVILPHSISLCHSPTNNVTSPFADTWPKLIFTYCQVVVRIIVLYFIALMSSKGSSMLFVTKRYYFFISAPTC